MYYHISNERFQEGEPSALKVIRAMLYATSSMY